MEWVLRRRARRIALLLAGVFAVAANTSAIADPSLLACGSASSIHSLATQGEGQKPGPLVVSIPPDAAGAVLIAEEHGSELEWRRGDGKFQPIDTRPPRYGLLALRMGEKEQVEFRAVAARPGQVVTLRLACAKDDEALQMPACLSGIGDLFGPRDGWCGALRLHTAAANLGRAGDSASALLVYQAAAEAWHARGDAVREGAALLGVVEMLVRLGRHGEVAAVADRSAAASMAGGSRYFALRAKAEHCLALRELEERQAAPRCLAPLPAALLAIGETAEAANIYYSLGNMADSDGDWRAAARWLAQARKLDLRAAYPEIVGRLDVLSASLQVLAGRVAPAMAELDDAAGIFEKTRNGRWLANAYLRMARLYGQLGAWEQARVLAANALTRLPARNAPQRRAEALRVLAHAHAALEEPVEAAAKFTQARALYESERAPLRVLALWLDEATMLQSAQALQQAGALAATLGDVPPRQQALLSLAHAEQDWRAGNPLAAERLEAIPADLLELRDLLRLRRLQAQASAGRGDFAGAFALLDSEIARLRHYAMASSAAALRHLVGQRLAELRRTWVDLYTLAPPARRPGHDAVWAMLGNTAAQGLLRSPSGAAQGLQAEAVDRELSALLLQPLGESDALQSATGLQRALLRYYAQQPRSHSAAVATSSSPMPALQAVSGSLAPGEHVLAPALGARGGLVLHIDAAGSRVALIADAQQLRADLARLRSLVASADSAVARIAESAQRVSAHLFGEDMRPAPGRLLLVDDPDLAGLPWALLAWPGQPGPLVEHSIVSHWLAGPLLPKRGRRPVPQVVRYLGFAGGGARNLPLLDATSAEAGWIGAALSGVVVTPVDAAAGRAALLEQLRQPQGWLHVATHGATAAASHSYSGIWLPPTTAAGRPEFLSWLDVVQNGASADLVVLNACALAADERRALLGSTNFATAVSAAGARDVVAALWPVSDAAARTWIPAFYSAAAGTDDFDAGFALQHAQLALRASRQFRHPFYWASLLHLTQ
jgi:CHAT domain